MVHARDRRFLRSKNLRFAHFFSPRQSKLRFIALGLPKKFGTLRSAIVCASKYACDLRLMRISLSSNVFSRLASSFPNLCRVNPCNYRGAALRAAWVVLVNAHILGKLYGIFPVSPAKIYHYGKSLNYNNRMKLSQTLMHMKRLPWPIRSHYIVRIKKEHILLERFRLKPCCHISPADIQKAAPREECGI